MSAERRAATQAATQLDNSLFLKLVRVVNLTARPFNEGIGRRHTLSLSDWRVMTVVGGHPGTTASEVCARTGMDKMSVSRAIAALARKRRVSRKADPNDGRRTLLELSSTGQRLFDEISAGARVREQQLFGGLSAADQTRLSETLDRLIDALLAVDAGPTGES